MEGKHHNTHILVEETLKRPWITIKDAYDTWIRARYMSDTKHMDHSCIGILLLGCRPVLLSRENSPSAELKFRPPYESFKAVLWVLFAEGRRLSAEPFIAILPRLQSVYIIIPCPLGSISVQKSVS
eukprot:Gb_04310 [translate_table: standard]